MAQDVSHIFQDPEFKRKFYKKIGKQGQKAYTFEAVRTVAQQHGFVGNDLEIIETPTKENAFTAVVIARIHMMEDDAVRTYTGIGDANPNNLTSATKKAVIRMAETRSMARAFRNALQVGEAVFEEYDGSTEDSPPKNPSQKSTEEWDEPHEIDDEVVIETKDQAIKEINTYIRTGKISAQQVKDWANEILGTENLRDEEVTFDQTLEVLDKVELEYDAVMQKAG